MTKFMYDADIKKSFLSEIKLFLDIRLVSIFSFFWFKNRYLATIAYTQVDIYLKN